MNQKKKRIIFMTVLIGFMGVAVFFRAPISPTSKQFKTLTKEARGTAKPASEIFGEEDIVHLPLPVRRYFRYCGYLGTPKMSYMKAYLENVDFVMSEAKTIKIDYEQLNLVERPDRYAFISSSLFGIPFEGLDSYGNGTGSMKGTLAKIIPLFNQRGENMDRSCLVTWLAECLLVPNAALQDFVNWYPMDDTHAKVSISWKGISAEGVFGFAESGELLDFRTSDRVATDVSGKETEVEWSALFRDYHLVNGLLQPRIIQSIWHYSEGDCVYFNQNEAAFTIEYDDEVLNQIGGK